MPGPETRPLAWTAVTAAWTLYLFVLPFHRIWTLPWLGDRLQPPEVAFLGLAAVAALFLWRGAVRWRFALADVAAIGWLGATVLALAWSPGVAERGAVIETMGVAYLVCLYATVRMTASPHVLDRYGHWFGYAAAGAAAVGIAGSALSFMGYPTSLATVAVTPVPYLGYAARAKAFTTGPQMLASILLVAIPLFVANRMERAWRLRDIVVVLVLAVGLCATISKTGLCLIASLCVMWAAGPRPAGSSRRAARWQPGARSAAAVWVATAVVFAAGSHVMVVREAAVPLTSASQLVAGRPFAAFSWAGESWVVMPTTYYFNKRASVLAIWRSWPIGLGPAAQPQFALQLKHEGQYPPSVWLTDPHSTYLGPVAELGAAGLAALGLLLAAGVTTIRRLIAADTPRRWESAAFAGIGAGFLIEAISTDLLNCRHYWFLLAVMAARLVSESARRQAGARPTDQAVASG